MKENNKSIVYHLLNSRQMHHGSHIVDKFESFGDRFIIKSYRKKDGLTVAAGGRDFDGYFLKEEVELLTPISYYLKLLTLAFSRKKIALHGYDVNWIILSFVLKIFLRNRFKSIWVCWGSGVNPNSGKWLIKWLRLKFRRALYRRFDKIVVLMSPEKEMLVNSFGIADEFVEVIPYLKIPEVSEMNAQDTPSIGDSELEQAQERCIYVIIGNSGSKSLNHLYWLHLLSRSSNESTRIVPIVFSNYSATAEYLDEVNSLYENLFPSENRCFRKFIDAEEYHSQFKDADILIQDIKTQLGLGAVYEAIATNVTVYVRKNSFISMWLDHIGIKYKLAEEVKSCDDLFVFDDETLFTNRDRFYRYFSVERLVPLWNRALYRD